jgi:hypothetical protein
MTAFPTSNTRRIFEIMAVVFTAIGKFVFMDYLNWRFAYVAVVIISWSIYIFLRNKTNSEIVKSWGFRNDNILAVSKRVLPFAIVAIAISFFFGFYQNTINITWHIIPILILYPIWGIIQQFLLIGLTAGNLQDLKGLGLNRRIIILFSSLLFSSVHYPFI